MKKEQASLSRRVLSALLSVLLATQPLLPAVAATLTPTGNTQLDHAANGVPVVNIAPPNAAGISHNKYQDYNVGKEGLILNNATGKVNQTQLGGLIQGNGNLKAGQEAAGIINEVTGTNRSQLQGYTEVAGKAANVIVANPYGITCNGCGFINTPNATLTTGKPVLDANGRLQSLDVSKGSILIEGQGLDGSQSDAVSIISRATDINAQLHAKSLTVITGANRVATDGSISPISGEGDAPKVAVDTGALGGMYANRIRLISSEKGVGVNLGNLNARDGDISLDASGKLTLKNSLASGALMASGEDIELSGDHKAGGELVMRSQNDIGLNNSTLLSDQDVQLTATGKLTQRGGKMTAGQALTLTGSDIALDSQATVDAAGDIALTASNSALTQGAITAGKQLLVTGGTLINDGQWRTGESARVKANRFVNHAAVVADGELAIDADTLQQSGVLNAAGNLNLSGKTLNTQVGSQTQTLANLVMRGDTLALNGTHAAKGALDFTATEQLTHSGNSTAASMTLISPTLTNSGVLLAPELALRSQQITNSGLIQGSQSLSLIAGLLNNQQSGMIYSATSLALASPTVSNSGVIASDADLTITGDVLTNSGKISARSLHLTHNRVNNHALGLLLTQESASLSANDAFYNEGQLLTGGKMTVTTPQFTNIGWWQADRLELNAASAVNSGTLLSNSALTINADKVDQQQDGALFSAGDMLVNTSGFTSLGQVVALGNVTLNLINAFTGTSTLAAGKTLTITSQGAITNQSVMQGNAVNLAASGEFTNNGKITTGSGGSQISGSKLLFSEKGSLQGGGDITLNSRGDVTLAGFTGTAGSLTINAAGTLLNTALLYAANNMQLFAERIHNRYGDILAGNRLWMQKNSAGAANTEIVNTSGHIETQGSDITIKTRHLLNERDGLNATEQAIENPDAISDLGKSTLRVAINQLPEGSVGLYEVIREYTLGGCGWNGSCIKRERIYHYYAPYIADAIQRFRWSTNSVSVEGKAVAARIQSGGNLFVSANTLDNHASNIVASGDLWMSGEELNNKTWQSGTQTEYLVYKYTGPFATLAESELEDESYDYKHPDDDTILFTLTGRETDTTTGNSYRAVIQAGGNISADFTRDISNTLTTANSEGISNTLAAPELDTLSNPTIPHADADQGLIAAISGADTRVYPLPSGNDGYFITNSDPDNPYLITVNPKLDGLGQLDPSLFGDLWKLLGVNPGAAPRETARQYTDRKQFLGSAYMLDRIGLDPEKNYRFLGDAAFDTRYVSNYVLNQTGTRYLNGLGSDLDQMRYLMDSAADAQTSLGLTFGVALTADQIAALDHSLLWWETVTVNGQTVMVPKVYLAPKDATVQSGSVISGNNVQLAGGNVTNSGSSLLAQKGLSIDSSNSISNLNAGLLITGGGLNLSALGDINNIGSTLSGKTVGLESVTGSINNITQTQMWNVDAGRVRLSGTDVGATSSITATDGLVMRAGQDINITGSNVAAGGSLGMAAGNDITITANEIVQSETRSAYQTASVTQQRSTLTAGDDLTLLAGHDLNARAAGIAAEGDVGMRAGRDLNLLAEATSESASSKAKKKTAIDASVRQQGTEIASGGNTVIIAGRDINAQAAEVMAQGDIGVAAGRDVNLTTATESDYRYREKTKTSSGFLSKKTTHTINEDSATREKGSLLSGDNVAVQAGNNLLVKGSAVAGDGDVALSAGNNVDIVAATNTDTSWRFKETRKSGLMGTGGIGFTLGTSKSTHDLREQGTTQSGSFSTVGSTGGDVSITAGKQAHIGGADIIAQQDITVRGDSVAIAPGHDKRTRDEKYEQKSSGLTVALSGAAGSALNSAVTMARDAASESDDRLATLKATKAALSGVQTSQGVDLAQAKGEPDNGIGVSLSLTTQKSKSEQHAQRDAVTGSTLNAGGDLAITATGQGRGANSGDILIAGSQLKAGGDTALAAANDIVLGGAASTEKTTGKNSSSGGGVGVSVGGGPDGYGIGVFANVNTAKGREKGNGTAWTETTLDSGGTVSMTSGRDAILDGAQVSGNAIVVDIGRDLLMRSQQDSNDYKSKQTSVAAGGSFTFGSMTGSGYISASQDKMNSTFDSVQEQTGLYAGDGGFDIAVGRHTQLDGAVIASMAQADKNRLETGTLGFSDIHNKADYRVSHSGISMSGGGSFGNDTFTGTMPGGMVSAGGSSGHAEGITRAAVASGTITVRDPANQQQDVADLSRDTAQANGSLSPIF
uniref:hemagglutinin repeat-containing protein n=1 Tax=Leclercia sp. TaxID=1898428 RepID=UPI002FDC8772